MARLQIPCGPVVVNSVKMIFMKRDGSLEGFHYHAMHRIFVDIMKHAPTANIFLMSLLRVTLEILKSLEDIISWRVSSG